jgi:hypothetical protein
MARGYATSLCFTTAAAYVVLRITDGIANPRKKILLYVSFALLALLAILSHYLSVAIFIFLAIWLVTSKNFFKEHLLTAALAFVIISAIMFLWMKNGGSEGLEEMRKIDAWYLKNTSEQVHTSPRSLAEGSIQQLMGIFGNYGQYLGFRLRSIAFLLVFPITAILLSLNLYKNIPARKAVTFFGGAVISVVAFSALLAVKAGHTTSFNARYGVYAIPFASALLAAALHAVASGSMSKMKKFFMGFSLAVTFIVFIFSAIPAYSGIAATYHSNPQLHKDILDFKLDKYYSNDQYEPLAKRIEHMYAAGDTVIYSDWNTAQVVNLFLRNSDKSITQTVHIDSKNQILLYEHVSGSYKIIPQTGK